MDEPVLPMPVSPPEAGEVSPGLCDDGGDPDLFCVWLADRTRRAFASDGRTEAEVDYRRHRRWSRNAVRELSEEYTERMPGVMDPSEDETLDGLMHSICFNLRDEPSRWSWSYLFNAAGGRSYVCVRRYAERLCGSANAGDLEPEACGDAEVVERVRRMYAEDTDTAGSL